MAWVLSLIIPGVGQAYCGKTGRGASIAFFFAVAVFGVILLAPSTEDTPQRLWWLGLRVTIVLYALAPLDAYFTVREINAGEEWAPYENPRVAALLNLLGLGLGYLYLGERDRALTTFALLGLLSRSELTSVEVLVEVALIVIAIDAYLIGDRRGREPLDPRGSGRSGLTHLDLREAPPETSPILRRRIAELEETPSALGPAVPVGLTCFLAFAYLRVVSLGIEAPNYKVIDQSRASVAVRGGEQVYRNPLYGVEARLPLYWKVEKSREDSLFTAGSMNSKCSVTLILESALPFASLDSKATALTEQIFYADKQVQFLRNRPEKLGNLSGYEIAFVAHQGQEEWFQSHVLAIRGLTVYRLVTTGSGDFARPCQGDAQRVRGEIVISK